MRATIFKATGNFFDLKSGDTFFSVSNLGLATYPVEIRPIQGEVFPSTLLVECAKEMHTNYPPGTVFRICAALKQKEDSRPHLYSSYRWPFIVVSSHKLK